ncbi:MAG: DNA ligase [Opitutus sp.]|nr:DNA ligase [Opitutus sp.]
MSGAEARKFLLGGVTAEEKVDGANLGLSVGPDGRIRAQSRGNNLAPGRSHAQWNPIWPWLAAREQALAAALGSDLILYGEWCHARHTISYDHLPDWFLAFDVFEPKTGVFWSSGRRNALAAQLGVATPHEVFRGRLALRDAARLIAASHFGTAEMEGVYFRRENSDRLLARAKVVSAEFNRRIVEHWSRRAVVANRRSVEAAISP